LANVKRLVLPTLLAVTMTAIGAFAAAGWANTTSCGSSTFKICVSKDDNNTVPKAVTSTSDSSYIGDFYYNNPNTINDSVSSMQNWYSARDVIFHHDPNNNGDAMCVDSLYEYDSISIFHDDQFSSHALTSGDGAC